MTTAAELRAIFLDHSLTEVDGMNLLQENGIISDNCIGVEDVPDTALEAVEQFFTRTQ